jgi:hypothetical protein
MMRFRNKAILVVFVLVLAQLPAVSWGEEGHLWINLVAAQKIPATMPAFLRANAQRISWLGPEPDRWRNQHSEPSLKASQEPDHFIDMERIPADFGELPVSRYDFIKRLYEMRAKALAAGMDVKKADELLPEKVGLQPYITMENYERLKVAFRQYRHALAAKRPTANAEQNAIFYAGWLGHYVADGAQPLHVTINYDGWVQENPNGYIGPKHGIHSDYETRYVRENFSPNDFAPLVTTPTRLQHPFADYMAYLRESLSLVEPLYQLQKAGGIEGKGSPQVREFTRKRLAAGSQMLLNLWYTAWMESAVDPPDPYAKPNPAKK